MSNLFGLSLLISISAFSGIAHAAHQCDPNWKACAAGALDSSDPALPMGRVNYFTFSGLWNQDEGRPLTFNLQVPNYALARTVVDPQTGEVLVRTWEGKDLFQFGSVSLPLVTPQDPIMFNAEVILRDDIKILDRTEVVTQKSCIHGVFGKYTYISRWRNHTRTLTALDGTSIELFAREFVQKVGEYPFCIGVK